MQFQFLIENSFIIFLGIIPSKASNEVFIISEFAFKIINEKDLQPHQISLQILHHSDHSREIMKKKKKKWCHQAKSVLDDPVDFLFNWVKWLVENKNLWSNANRIHSLIDRWSLLAIGFRIMKNQWRAIREWLDNFLLGLILVDVQLETLWW